MSAALLREAAALMRERAEKATSGPWEFRPRRGFQSVNDNPATIGFVDTAGYFVMFREGRWATENDMGYIASWHPAVALAVADWLSMEADEVSEYATAIGATVEQVERAYREPLNVARAYLGRDS